MASFSFFSLPLVAISGYALALDMTAREIQSAAKVNNSASSVFFSFP